MPEDARLYDGSLRRDKYVPSGTRGDTDVAALRKAASANMTTLPARLTRAALAKAAEDKRKAIEKAERRTYLAALRAKRREVKDEIKALKPVLREYERKHNAGTITKYEWGCYEEADHRFWQLHEDLDDMRRMLKKGW